MDLRQLRQVATIIDCGSIGRSAEQLNLSQPALTKSIRKLESELAKRK